MSQPPYSETEMQRPNNDSPLPGQLTAAVDSSDKAKALEKLRKRFDEKLACLNEPGAGERLEQALRSPANLNGKVIAGETY